MLSRRHDSFDSVNVLSSWLTVLLHGSRLDIHGSDSRFVNTSSCSVRRSGRTEIRGVRPVTRLVEGVHELVIRCVVHNIERTLAVSHDEEWMSVMLTDWAAEYRARVYQAVLHVNSEATSAI